MSRHSSTPHLSLDEQRRQALDRYPFKDDWWFLLRSLDAQKPVHQILSLFDSDYLAGLLNYTPRLIVHILKDFEPFLVFPYISLFPVTDPFPLF